MIAMLLSFLFAYMASISYGMNGAGGYLLESSDGEWVEPIARSFSAYAEPNIANFLSVDGATFDVVEFIKRKLDFSRTEIPEFENFIDGACEEVQKAKRRRDYDGYDPERFRNSIWINVLFFKSEKSNGFQKKFSNASSCI